MDQFEMAPATFLMRPLLECYIAHAVLTEVRVQPAKISLATPPTHG